MFWKLIVQLLWITRKLEMETEYSLRYCYRYEPGFDVHCLNDIILYENTDDISGEVYDYLNKEDELIDKEDEFQLFFRVVHFKHASNVSKIPFLKLELFPQKSKDDSVVNLVYVPLKRDWKAHSNLEQLLLVDEELKKQEREVDMRYKLVGYSVESIEVDGKEGKEESG
jgi:hypothetical protein